MSNHSTIYRNDKFESKMEDFYSKQQSISVDVLKDKWMQRVRVHASEGEMCAAHMYTQVKPPKEFIEAVSSGIYQVTAERVESIWVVLFDTTLMEMRSRTSQTKK